MTLGDQFGLLAKTITIGSPANLLGLVVIVASVFEIQIPVLKRCMCRMVSKSDDDKEQDDYLHRIEILVQLSAQWTGSSSREVAEHGTPELFHVINILAISCFKVETRINGFGCGMMTSLRR